MNRKISTSLLLALLVPATDVFTRTISEEERKMYVPAFQPSARNERAKKRSDSNRTVLFVELEPQLRALSALVENSRTLTAAEKRHAKRAHNFSPTLTPPQEYEKRISVLESLLREAHKESR
jgi:hypothetical protein